MTGRELFDLLDLDGDGRLRRDELSRAARQLGWGREHAHFHALLDYLTVLAPLEREAFLRCLEEIEDDPQGVYGRALRRGPLGGGARVVPGGAAGEERPARGAEVAAGAVLWDGTAVEGMAGVLREVAGSGRAGEYVDALSRLGVAPFRASSAAAALLLVDPQRAFTEGQWMRRLGPAAELEVMPIRQAFDNCARLLQAVYRRVEVMFTRCPFAPEDFGWDAALSEVVDERQLYFVKPSNDLLLPDGNGARAWIAGLVERGVRTLVLGGCTLNSCLRVSALSLRRAFPPDRLDLVVDLQACGARASNYLGAAQFDGRSPVEAALVEMASAGVVLADRVEWS